MSESAKPRGKTIPNTKSINLPQIDRIIAKNGHHGVRIPHNNNNNHEISRQQNRKNPI